MENSFIKLGKGKKDSYMQIKALIYEDFSQKQINDETEALRSGKTLLGWLTVVVLLDQDTKNWYHSVNHVSSYALIYKDVWIQATKVPDGKLH